MTNQTIRTLATLVLSLGCSAITLADPTTPPASATAPSVDTSASQANTFSQMEALDQGIEAAGREITALKMNAELKTLKDQAEKMKTDFVVIRIYGFDNNLKAALKFNNNAIIDVQQGDKVDGHYRVTRITEKQVMLYDETSGKTINAPFDSGFSATTVPETRSVASSNP